MRTCVVCFFLHPAIRSVWYGVTVCVPNPFFLHHPATNCGATAQSILVSSRALLVCLLTPRDQPATARGRRVYLTFTYHACSQPLRRRAAALRARAHGRRRGLAPPSLRAAVATSPPPRLRRPSAQRHLEDLAVVGIGQCGLIDEAMRVVQLGHELGHRLHRARGRALREAELLLRPGLGRGLGSGARVRVRG